MPVQITRIDFVGQVKSGPKPTPENEMSKADKAAERERMISDAVAEAMAVLRRREDR